MNNITVNKTKWDEIQDLYTDYFDELGYKNDSFHKMINNQKNVDVGNFTLPQHRRKGVGRSIMINLSKIAIQQGLIPVAGCWYGNTESISTLTSSGFIPENRIFYIRFR